MAISEIREQIHKLVDEATESQLGAVLQVLEPKAFYYSKEEVDSFYNRAHLFEESGDKGMTVEESHILIRNKFKGNGL